MRRAPQGGFGLLEMLAVIVLGALLAGAILPILGQDWERARLRDVARRHAELAAATQRYLEARRDLLAGELAAGVATALPLDQLLAAGYLAPGFEPLNVYGHAACVLLLRNGSQVEALVSASGGQQPDPADLAEMAASAGPGAGYLMPAAPLRARGAFGAWTLDTASLQPFFAGACPAGPIAPGRLVSLLRQPLGTGAGAPDFLARRGPAVEAPWNVLETPLAMGGGAVAAVGQACGTAPAIALDSKRDLLSCAANGVWKRQRAGGTWKETSASHAALPAGDAPGDVRMTADTGRAYVARAGNAWQALAVDQNGHLEVPSQARAGTLVTRGHLDAGSVAAAGTIDAGRDVRASGIVRGREFDARNGAQSGANWVDGKTIVAGTACNLPGQKPRPDGSYGRLYPIGTAMRDANGVTLSCQSPHNQFRYLNGLLTP
jgi:hypothetical protein